MAEPLTFYDRTGAAVTGVIAMPPPRAGGVPGVVLLHEWWGVNGHIKSLVDRWAGEGFIALAPSLFGGVVAKTADEAKQLMNGLDRPRALEQIDATVGYLRSITGGNGKIGVTGYCMGGALAFAAATRVRGLAGVVPFYGLPGDGTDWSKVEAPVSAHFASRDTWATVDGAKAVQQALQTAGKTMELHVYDANHAFCNDTRPEVYDARAATTAWSRATAFLRARCS